MVREWRKKDKLFQASPHKRLLRGNAYHDPLKFPYPLEIQQEDTQNDAPEIHGFQDLMIFWVSALIFKGADLLDLMLGRKYVGTDSSKPKCGFR